MLSYCFTKKKKRCVAIVMCCQLNPSTQTHFRVHRHSLHMHKIQVHRRFFFERRLAFHVHGLHRLQRLPHCIDGFPFYYIHPSGTLDLILIEKD